MISAWRTARFKQLPALIDGPLSHWTASWWTCQMPAGLPLPKYVCPARIRGDEMLGDFLGETGPVLGDLGRRWNRPLSGSVSIERGKGGETDGRKARRAPISGHNP